MRMILVLYHPIDDQILLWKNYCDEGEYPHPDFCPWLTLQQALRLGYEVVGEL